MRKKVLVIYHIRNPHQTPLHSYRHIHVMDALKERYEVSYFNTSELWKQQKLPYLDLPHSPDVYKMGEYDVIILHYTFLIMRCIGERSEILMQPFGWLSDNKALKIAIPQDEGNHSGILDDWLFRWGVNVIFSVHYSVQGPLYQKSRYLASIYPCLPGYVNTDIVEEHLTAVKPLSKRSVDLVYRGRPFNLRYGSASYTKAEIVNKLGDAAKSRGLKTDISVHQEDRIYGDKWFEFISSAKSVFGVYGGYSAVDMRGEIKENVEYLKRDKGVATLKELNEYMPAGWDDHKLFTITPRHFESIACKTAQILIRNEYRGVLEAGRHYIPLESDCSNMDQVLDCLFDDGGLQEMVERAYEEIYLSEKYSYDRFAERISEAIEAGIPEATGAKGGGNNSDLRLLAASVNDRRSEREKRKYIYCQLKEEYENNRKILAKLASKKRGTLSIMYSGIRRIGVKMYRRFRRFIVTSYYYVRRYVVRTVKYLLRKE